MDEDAPDDTPLVRGWEAPRAATIILSGYTPGFVMLTTDRATDGDQIAQQFVIDAGVKGSVHQGRVRRSQRGQHDLHRTPADGSTVRAINVLTARGSYTPSCSPTRAYGRQEEVLIKVLDRVRDDRQHRLHG